MFADLFTPMVSVTLLGITPRSTVYHVVFAPSFAPDPGGQVQYQAHIDQLLADATATHRRLWLILDPSRLPWRHVAPAVSVRAPEPLQAGDGAHLPCRLPHDGRGGSGAARDAAADPRPWKVAVTGLCAPNTRRPCAVRVLIEKTWDDQDLAPVYVTFSPRCRLSRQTCPREVVMNQTPTVLIVEDVPVLGEILARIVTHYRPQARTLTVTSVQAAQQILHDQAVTAVITDYVLPDGTGFGVLTTAHGYDQAIPVVVVSGRRDVAHAMLAAGAAGFVLKPFEMEEVLALLQQVL